MKSKKKYILKTQYPGFSLIEMAVVLSILGLFLGGILKGKQLYDFAKLNAVIEQLQDIRLAIHQFEQNFGALPGDYTNASSIQEGLFNGDGNGVVDLYKKDHVWKHLHAAGFFPSPMVPVSKIGGLISFQYAPQPDFLGHWIVIGQSFGSNNLGALLTPEQAFFIDKKIDDGLANSGKVRALKGEGAQGECFLIDGSYNLMNKNPACVLLINY